MALSRLDHRMKRTTGQRVSTGVFIGPSPRLMLTYRYFFAVANYFLYGESIIYYFKHIVFVDAYFIPFARNHRFISFMLYTVGTCFSLMTSVA
jgi:hypothetical protein